MFGLYVWKVKCMCATKILKEYVRIWSFQLIEMSNNIKAPWNAE